MADRQYPPIIVTSGPFVAHSSDAHWSDQLLRLFRAWVSLRVPKSEAVRVAPPWCAAGGSFERPWAAQKRPAWPDRLMKTVGTAQDHRVAPNCSDGQLSDFQEN